MKSRNALAWLESEYLAIPPARPNGRDTSHITTGLLLNENPDRTWKCCGGFREHFTETCMELCAFCGKGLSASGWNSTWANGPNGFPAHPGCVDDRAWDHYSERPHDDEAMDVPESVLHEVDEL